VRTLKSIVAKVQAADLIATLHDQAFECQIYQISRTPGVRVSNVGAANYSSVAFTDFEFAPLLTPAPIVTKKAADWAVNTTQSLTFDFSNYALVLENAIARGATPDQAGLLPQYLIVVRPVASLSGKALGGTGHYRWLTDTVASHIVANVGTFERVFWSRADENSQWISQAFADVPNVIINIEAYPATGVGVFMVDMGRSAGRAVYGPR
jgi:hypothetical protein